MMMTNLMLMRKENRLRSLPKNNLRLRKKNLRISQRPPRKVKRRRRLEDVVVVAAGVDAGGEARKKEKRERMESRSLGRTSPLPSSSSKPMSVPSRESRASQGKVATVGSALLLLREARMPRTNGEARVALELADAVVTEKAGVVVTSAAETEEEMANKEVAEVKVAAVAAVEKDRSIARHPGNNNSKHRNRNTNKKESKKIIESN